MKTYIGIQNKMINNGFFMPTLIRYEKIKCNYKINNG